MNIDFERIKETIAVTAKKAKKISENTIESTKLKLKLSELKSDVKSRYTQIGKLVYESNEDCDNTEEIEKICMEISEIQENICDITDTLNDIANTKKCPKCNSDVKKDYEFCPKCGYEFND